MNPAERPPIRPDSQIGYANMTAKLLATLADTAITVSFDDHLPEIKAVLETDILATEIWPTLVDVSNADESQW